MGFSWTTAFFGPFPMLFRKSWKWFAISFVLFLITWGISPIVFMFIINKLYIKELLADGYTARSVKMGTIESVGQELGLTLSLPATDTKS